MFKLDFNMPDQPMVSVQTTENRGFSFYMREAIRSDRTTVYNALKDSGNPELADAIRRL